MAVRGVADFDSKQWEQLMENMKRGPTKKMKETMERAQKQCRNVKVNF